MGPTGKPYVGLSLNFSSNPNTINQTIMTDNEG